MKSSDISSNKEEILKLKDQVATLEELLQVYEQTATEQEQRLQETLQSLQERAQQLTHAQDTLETLETILESMGDAVVVTDRDGQQLFSNPAAQAMFQEQDHSLLFDHWSQTYKIFNADGLDYPNQTQLPMFRAIQGESLDAVELLFIDHRTDNRRWLSVNARPLHAEAEVIGGVAVFRDVTKQKQVEQALKASNEEAQKQTQLLEQTLQQLRQTQTQLIHEEKMASLGKTVAGIAHEINNPVNFIQGNLSHAQQAFQDLIALVHKFQVAYPNPPVAIAADMAAIDVDFLATDIPKLLESMQVGTTRIDAIVQSLRTFSRLDESSFKAVDIHAGIDSTLAILQSRLQKQPHRPAITLIKQYGSLPQVECYAGELNQAFNHLLSNAIDAVDDGISNPTIMIATEVQSQTIKAQTKTQTGETQTGETQTVKICITDNGIGIPHHIQPRIFDPFFTTKAVGKGTGLGLAICHQIVVNSHKGRLACYSQEHQGSQFVITLPIK